ncbi:hypothetical protein GCM10022284_50850 [Streptomyces hundungensis]
MLCAVCEMWGIKREARYLGPWSDNGREHGRCKACLPLEPALSETFKLIPDVVHPCTSEGVANQYYVTFSHPNVHERDIPAHVWAESSRDALKYVREEMFKAPTIWDGWDVELTGGVQYGEVF